MTSALPDVAAVCVFVESVTRCYRARVITTLRISGMTCNGCVKHVDKALRGVPGVSAVEVSLPDQRAKVVHEDSAPVQALVTAVESAGYTAAV
jgi:copper chaperone